ncbi:putative mitochondrial protein [Cucumis melo var. makuwa]|uniref:Mitochondrial protein n=1 Tax=Cucumis melo var. makuwa TaxID=1194695 RepID=A0A5A7SZ99_CUCMM|nr:putative mitochondrial protein [Cucumis melo var. makuwa]TYK19053.1 putative mitochondrial protein [Cucumis melo var. makuwa]
MMSNQQLVKEGKLCKDLERYRRLIGKLNYLTATQQDIAYSVSVVRSREDRGSTSGYCVFVGEKLVSWKSFRITVPSKLWCDNQAALHIVSNQVFYERTKHIELDCPFIREKIQDGLVYIGYVKTGERFGDILTKAINGARISYLCNKLDMIDIFAPA